MKYPVYKPYFSGKEKKYVNQAIESGWISSKGKFVQQFEKSFAKYVGAKYALTTCNGTTALHLALLSAAIKDGDEVIVPTLTYIATANAIKYCNAKPVFVDCFSGSWQMNYDSIASKITKKTKAIIAVHVYGFPCYMERVVEIAKQYNLILIEDCAEAIGSKFNNIHVGNFGKVSAFSFYGNKTITTGEGGMLITNEEKIYKTALKLRGQGLSADKEYWHDIIGYNYRMTNICAAIGLAQIEKIDTILKRKEQIAVWYFKYLYPNENIIHQQHSNKNQQHSWWMYSILLNNEKIRDGLRKRLKKCGIETRPLFNPIHLMPPYKTKQRLYVSEQISKRGINLPSYPDLNEKDIQFICNIINRYVG